MAGQITPVLVRAVVLCAAVAGAGVSSAVAQSVKDGFNSRPFPYINEVRLGAFAHQIEDSPGEKGVDVNVELLTGKIGAPRGDYLMDYFFRPRVHIGGNINTNGDTSEAYFGVTWDLPVTKWAFFETSFGGAAHDGYLKAEPGHSPLGCRVDFRESASLGFHLSERLDLLATIDHMSNAGLCDENRGLTNAGVRLGYKF